MAGTSFVVRVPCVLQAAATTQCVAHCPDSTLTLSGGYFKDEAEATDVIWDLLSFNTSTFTDVDGWSVAIWNPDNFTRTINVFALCLNPA